MIPDSQALQSGGKKIYKNTNTNYYYHHHTMLWRSIAHCGEFVEEPRAVETQETFVTIDDGTTVLMLVLFPLPSQYQFYKEVSKRTGQ